MSENNDTIEAAVDADLHAALYGRPLAAAPNQTAPTADELIASLPPPPPARFSRTAHGEPIDPATGREFTPMALITAIRSLAVEAQSAAAAAADTAIARDAARTERDEFEANTRSHAASVPKEVREGWEAKAAELRAIFDAANAAAIDAAATAKNAADGLAMLKTYGHSMATALRLIERGEF